MHFLPEIQLKLYSRGATGNDFHILLILGFIIKLYTSTGCQYHILLAFFLTALKPCHTSLCTNKERNKVSSVLLEENDPFVLSH